MVARHVRTLARRTWSVLVTLLIVTITLAGLAYLAPTVLGYERYVLTGGSMSGTYEKGSVVFEQRVPVTDLVVGDVITYLPPGDSGVTTLVTHRIAEMTHAQDGTTLFRTRGDANADADPWTFALVEDTQPVVRFGVPYVGWAVIALADRGTRMLVLGVPAAIIALMSLVELVSNIAAERRGRREPGTATVPAATSPTS